MVGMSQPPPQPDAHRPPHSDAGLTPGASSAQSPDARQLSGTDDFLHPLPRRYGTGVPALAKLAEARSAGWGAVARVLASVDEAWMQWVMDASVEDLEQALGWRQGEEDLFGSDLFALNSWRVARTRRGDTDAQRERVAGLVTRHSQADALSARADSFRADCAREAEAWASGDVVIARAARAEQAAALGESGSGAADEKSALRAESAGGLRAQSAGAASSESDNAGGAQSAEPRAEPVERQEGAGEPVASQLLAALRSLPGDVTPVRYLQRLTVLFVELETGGNTLKHLR